MIQNVSVATDGVSFMQVDGLESEGSRHILTSRLLFSVPELFSMKKRDRLGNIRPRELGISTLGKRASHRPDNRKLLPGSGVALVGCTASPSSTTHVAPAPQRCCSDRPSSSDGGEGRRKGSSRESALAAPAPTQSLGLPPVLRPRAIWPPNPGRRSWLSTRATHSLQLRSVQG